jgi:hypothetical protein
MIGRIKAKKKKTFNQKKRELEDKVKKTKKTIE